MSIRWDSVLVRRLARELDGALSRSRLRALRLDASSRDLVLLFRDRTLLWRLHPDRGHLSFSDPLEPETSDLRLKSRLRGVRAPSDDRILRFTLLPERGRGGVLELIVELIGNRWNAVVVEAPDAVIRHVLVRRDGSRPLRVGHPYRVPRPTDRDDDPDLAGWLTSLRPVPPEERARALVRSYAWTSPLNAATILGSAATDAGEEALRGAFGRWRRIATGDDPRPIVYARASGLQPYPFPLTGVTVEPVESLLDAFARCARAAEARGEAAVALSVPPELVAELKETIRHHERRIARLRAEQRELEDPTRLRGVGDLILARYHEIRPGAAEVVLTDFDGRPITVELDATLKPNENADRYYTRAGKAERGRERLPTLIEEAERVLDRYSTLLDRVTAGDATADEVRAALPAASVRKGRSATTPSLPYRTFRSSGGLEIRVGRGSKHNDDLTFRHSSPGDVWLHARHTAGAHVVLRWQGRGGPPARDLSEAAALAALHSKARTSSSVPVDWTLRKYVRKPRGAPPGRVAVERVKTVFVEPDAALIDELAEPA